MKKVINLEIMDVLEALRFSVKAKLEHPDVPCYPITICLEAGDEE